jgi:hypothetical protein
MDRNVAEEAQRLQQSTVAMDVLRGQVVHAAESEGRRMMQAFDSPESDPVEHASPQAAVEHAIGLYMSIPKHVFPARHAAVAQLFGEKGRTALQAVLPRGGDSAPVGGWFGADGEGAHAADFRAVTVEQEEAAERQANVSVARSSPEQQVARFERQAAHEGYENYETAVRFGAKRDRNGNILDTDCTLPDSDVEGTVVSIGTLALAPAPPPPTLPLVGAGAGGGPQPAAAPSSPPGAGVVFVYMVRHEDGSLVWLSQEDAEQIVSTEKCRDDLAECEATLVRKGAKIVHWGKKLDGQAPARHAALLEKAAKKVAPVCASLFAAHKRRDALRVPAWPLAVDGVDVSALAQDEFEALPLLERFRKAHCICAEELRLTRASARGAAPNSSICAGRWRHHFESAEDMRAEQAGLEGHMSASAPLLLHAGERGPRARRPTPAARAAAADVARANEAAAADEAAARARDEESGVLQWIRCECADCAQEPASAPDFAEQSPGGPVAGPDLPGASACDAAADAGSAPFVISGGKFGSDAEAEAERGWFVVSDLTRLQASEARALLELELEEDDSSWTWTCPECTKRTNNQPEVDADYDSSADSASDDEEHDE